MYSQKVNIGIYYDVNHSNLRSGGGATYQETVLKGLLECPKRDYDLYLFHQSGISLSQDIAEGFNKVIPITPYNCQRALIDDSIALLWSLTPALPFIPEVPYILPVWDLQHRRQPFFPEVSISGWQWQDRDDHYERLLTRATYILTGTETGKQEVSFFYKIMPERVVVIPFAVKSVDKDLIELGDQLIKDHNSKEELLKIKGKYLFYPAQFWPHKNHILILLAIRQLKDRYGLKVPVVFTGSDHGNLEYVKEKCKELEIDDIVRFEGFVSKATLYWLYQNALLMVFPTFFGPDNIPPLEAFMHGCPVAASDVPGTREQLGDGVLYFDPKDEDSLVDVISRVLNEPAIGSELISKGYKKVSDLTPFNYVQRVFAVIDDFMKIRRTWGNEFIYYGTPRHFERLFGEKRFFKALEVAKDINNLKMVDQIQKVVDVVTNLNQQVEGMILNKDFIEAEKLLNHIIDACSDYAYVYNNLALLHYGNGNTYEALKYINIARRLSNDDPHILENHEIIKSSLTG